MVAQDRYANVCALGQPDCSGNILVPPTLHRAPFGRGNGIVGGIEAKSVEQRRYCYSKGQSGVTGADMHREGIATEHGGGLRRQWPDHGEPCARA